MISDFTTENYLKAIVKALAEPGRDRIGTGELARLLGVTSGTATVMAKKLERDGYLEYESHRGCSLTEAGWVYGLRVLRRHRLLETFLIKILDLDWSAVHDEAESLEHAASEKLIDAIDEFLGYPARDPNGDLIPSKFQTEYTVGDSPLCDHAEGTAVKIVRIFGDKDTLSYYRGQRLVPGSVVRIDSKQPAAGLAALSIEGKTSTFALSALGGVFVEAAPGGDSPE